MRCDFIQKSLPNTGQNIISAYSRVCYIAQKKKHNGFLFFAEKTGSIEICKSKKSYQEKQKENTKSISCISYIKNTYMLTKKKSIIK